MRSFKIGSAFGIPIKLDLTFLLILPVFAYLIGSQISAQADLIQSAFGVALDTSALTAGTTPWLLGVVAAVGLFAGVVLHELGHSLVAQHYGYPIDSITLWILGGIANLTDTPEDWKQEFQIAIAGPVVSIVIGVVCAAVLFVLPGDVAFAKFVVGYLALMNLVLAAFNLLPGFPMDGGRVLRALLARSRPYARATQIAAEVGKGFAVLLGILGLLAWNLIFIGIAFFIYIGAASEAQQTMMSAVFEDVTVGDIMTPVTELKTVSPSDSVADLTERMFRERHTGYPVIENGEIVGMVTLGDAREVDPVERDAYTVEDIMSKDVKTIDKEENAMTALERIQQESIGRLIVTNHHGELVGLISRTDLMTAFDIIQSSGRQNDAPTARVKNA
ncbi:CBS domain-containing protein [Halocalculus aciditolerans]|uniref:Zinc metalloprotease n=1 Tax=Halocalculus aciditolerans TaxID=1383812 RepID=A0A830FI17_9EURY|nr:CBS domain-containing protein [Halocalculus aciditolerans]GGL49281.1 metalloprotease [Halocalculus aciditolerans]